MLRLLFLLLLLTSCVYCQENVFDKIKNGFKLAGQLLGLDKATNVAELVSEAFHKNRKVDDGADKNVFSGFLRLFGFDSKKIGAIAINAIIFVVQLISTSLSKPPPAKVEQAKSMHGDPYDWLLNNENIKDLLKISKEGDLSSQINEYIKERTLPEESGCLQQLICKTTPFISGMQNAVNANEQEKEKGVKAMFQFMPSLDEVSDHSDICEEKYSYCSVDY